MANYYIEPNSDIYILTGCPLDSSYQHTIRFKDRETQFNWFMTNVSHTGYTKQTYQRKDRGYIRLETMSYPYSVGDRRVQPNYMMFRNTNFGSKWFYAFIDSIEYINNNTVEYHYTIDVMQTWLLGLDYTLQDCFVARQHAVTDNIGDNIVPEGLETGEYLMTTPQACISNTDPIILIGFSFKDIVFGDTAEYNSGGTFLNGLYNGVNYVGFDMTTDGVNDCTKFLSHYAGKASQILSLCLVPKAFSSWSRKQLILGTTSVFAYIPVWTTAPYNAGTIDLPDYDSAIVRSDGVTIKNNKMYTFPYNYIYLTDFQGGGRVLQYEYFGNADSPQAMPLGIMSCNPEEYVLPLNYKLSDTSAPNYDEAMAFAGFPQLPYTIDSFKAWLSQCAGSLGATVLNAGVTALTGNMIAGAMAGNAVTSLVPPTQPSVNDSRFAHLKSGALSIGGNRAYDNAMNNYNRELAKYNSDMANAKSQAQAEKLNNLGSTVQSVTSFLGMVRDHAVVPPMASGYQSSMSLASLKKLGIHYCVKHITPYYATIIDEYFNRYGYAQNRFMTPNVDSRQSWNYIQTAGCEFDTSSLPDGDAQMIKAIYDNGVTFWHDGNNIGNYSLANAIR